MALDGREAGALAKQAREAAAHAEAAASYLEAGRVSIASDGLPIPRQASWNAAIAIKRASQATHDLAQAMAAEAKD